MTSERFREGIEALKAAGLYRSCRMLSARAGGKVVVEGREVLDFSSNDYLGLAGDAGVKAASAKAVERWGCGAGASRLMSGTLGIHEELEGQLADLVGCERALVFGSGFLTNVGVMTTLGGKRHAIFADRLCHASIVDGALLAGAKLYRYRHNDVGHLEALLAGHAPAGGSVVVTESVFSMEGDLAPVDALGELSAKYGATFVVDEAHAIGVFGKGGGGLCREGRSAVRPDVVVGTLSKALGGYGGFASGSGAFVEMLVNKARSFIYSTGLPAACAGSALGALEAIAGRPEMGRTLLERAGFFRAALGREGLDTGGSASQIVPMVVGGNERALAISGRLLERGVFAVAVRPPTVPMGEARVRFSVTLSHTEEDLERAARAMGAACREAGML